MARFTVVTFLLVLVSIPAFGKDRNIYPVDCSELWSAVRDTLGVAGDYTVFASDDEERTASYTIVGAQHQRVNSVALNSKDAGCEMLVKAPYSGNSNDDEGLFRKRVGRSLAKLQAAKTSEGAKPSQGK